MRTLLSGLLNLAAIASVIVLIFAMFDARTTLVLIVVYGILAAGVASVAILGGERIKQGGVNEP